jgi:hypothetical protein
MVNTDPVVILTSHALAPRKSGTEEYREPFGMPFTNLEVAFVVANELNRQDQGLWFYNIERHIDDKRWIIVREDRALNPPAGLDCVCSQRHVI